MMFRNLLNERDIVNIGIRLLIIIERLHDQGICHLDIKPNNIMIGLSDEEAEGHPSLKNSSENEVFLIDFGMSNYYLELDTGKHIN